MAVGLLERETEREAILAALQNAVRGHGTLLFFVGEPGLGKTRVLDLAEELAAKNLVVVRAGGHELEKDYPYALVQQVLEQILGGYGRDLEEFAVVPDSLRRLLQRSLPVGSSPAEGFATRAELTYAFQWLVGSVAERKPLLLLLDELHWVDPESLSLLHSLARRIGPLPVALLGAFRPWPASGTNWAEDLILRERAGRLELKPLSREASGDLVVGGLAGTVAADRRAEAFAFTGGNPFLLEEFVKFLNWSREVSGGEGLSWPSTPQSLVLARLSDLPSESWRYLRAGSVIGSTFSASLAEEISELDPRELQPALEPLRRLGLLLAGGPGRFRFKHPMLRQAVYEGLTEEARRLAHRRTVTLLRQRGEGAMALASHLALGAATGDLEAIVFLGEAATEAATAGAYAVAADFLEKALRLEPPGPLRAKLLLGLGVNWLAAGAAPEAVAAFAEAIELVGLEPETRRQIRRSWASALLFGGDPAGARSQFELAVAETKSDHPVQAVDIAVERVVLSFTCGDLAEAGAAAKEALELGAWSGDAVALAKATVVTSLLAAGLGEPEALSRAREAAVVLLPSALDESEASFGFSADAAVGLIASRWGRYDEAQRLLTAALERGKKAHFLMATLWNQLFLSELEYRRGRLREAYNYLSEAVPFTKDVPYLGIWVDQQWARILGELGEFSAADEALGRVREMAGHGQVTLGMDLALWAEATLLSRQGQDQEALELFQAAAEGTWSQVPTFVDFNWRLEAAETAVRLGRLAVADRFIQTVLDSAMYRIHPGIQAAAWRAVGLHRAADGDGSGAAAAFESALARGAEAGESLEMGRTILAWGSFLRRSLRVKEARAVLHRAHRIFGACGSVPWRERAEAELRLAGGRRRTEGPTERLSILTAQEHRIGQLVAEGRSNREIACALFISLKTLETHLRHMYQKLGASSREDLRGYFSDLSSLSQGEPVC